jgi:choloylglycine hydrolase
MTFRPTAASAVIFAAALLYAAAASACTTFVLRDGDRAVFGKNLDWFTGAGLVIVNQRGLAKEGMATQHGEPPRWVSKYGSVTFNHVGKELATGGMNEAGLVVESMWLDNTEYPEPDGRSALVEGQWIQYQLDNHSSVAEVIASDSLLSITPTSTPLHFLMLDGSGQAAVVEFLEGEMVSYTGKRLKTEALANNTYKESMQCLLSHGIAGDNLSLKNFVDAATMVYNYGGGEGDTLVDYAFEILEEVATQVRPGHFTRWSIVYDMTNRLIYFRTNESRTLKYIDFESLDFACGSRPVAIDIHAHISGRVNQHMVDYTTELNRELVFKTFKDFAEHDFMDLPDSVLTYISEYPDGFDCAEE